MQCTDIYIANSYLPQISIFSQRIIIVEVCHKNGSDHSRCFMHIRIHVTVLWQAMIAESQYCWSGDNTVEATRAAIQQMTKEPGDEYFVIVFSDANFSRYGIRPGHFASLMNSDPRVNVFAIFIGSLGDQAEK